MSRDRKALEVYRKHTGKELPQSPLPGDSQAMTDATEITFKGTYETSWVRNELDMRTKSFICMAITATLGTETQFKRHVAAAQHIGISKDEIAAMLIHFMGYLGAPRTAVARDLVREVWADPEFSKQ